MECPICYESDKIMITIPCHKNIGHSICLGCFIHLEKKECPICRTNFESMLPNIKDTTIVSLIEFLNEQRES